MWIPHDVEKVAWSNLDVWKPDRIVSYLLSFGNAESAFTKSKCFKLISKFVFEKANCFKELIEMLLFL